MRRRPAFTFSQVMVENVRHWRDEDVGRSFYALECSRTDWKSKGKSAHRLLWKRFPRHLESLEDEYEKRHGEPRPKQRLPFVVRTRVRMNGEDVILIFFRFESEAREVEKSVLVRRLMEA